MTSSPSDSGYEFSFLPEVRDEAAQLPEDVRRALAAVVVELHGNPWLGEELDDRPPRILHGCRKVRFDAREHRGKPRYRLVYRNEPTDGAPGMMVVLAVGERRNMIAYAKAQTRHARRLRQRAGEVTRRREGLSATGPDAAEVTRANAAPRRAEPERSSP